MGLSRVYDQRAFAWSDERWQAPPLARAVIYEMHIGTFTQAGTFDAAIERLDYLVELGDYACGVDAGGGVSGRAWVGI